MHPNRDRRQQWFILHELVARELKRRYARSYLGVLWSVLHPLFSMMILSFIFSSMFQRTIAHYPIYYLSGYLIWQTFATATTHALSALADNRALLLKAKLSPSLLAAARVVTAFVNLGYSLIAYVLMLLVFGIGLHVRMFAAFLLFALLFLFTLGISYLLACAYMFFGDIKHLYALFLTLWMYCSAIFYPASQLEGLIRIVVYGNPLFCFIDALRGIVLQGVLPSAGTFGVLTLWSVGALLVGRWVFQHSCGEIVSRL